MEPKNSDNTTTVALRWFEVYEGYNVQPILDDYDYFYLIVSDADQGKTNGLKTALAKLERPRYRGVPLSCQSHRHLMQTLDRPEVISTAINQGLQRATLVCGHRFIEFDASTNKSWSIHLIADRLVANPACIAKWTPDDVVGEGKQSAKDGLLAYNPVWGNAISANALTNGLVRTIDRTGKISQSTVVNVPAGFDKIDEKVVKKTDVELQWLLVAVRSRQQNQAPMIMAHSAALMHPTGSDDFYDFRRVLKVTNAEYREMKAKITPWEQAAIGLWFQHFQAAWDTTLLSLEQTRDTRAFFSVTTADFWTITTKQRADDGDEFRNVSEGTSAMTPGEKKLVSARVGNLDDGTRRHIELVMNIVSVGRVIGKATQRERQTGYATWSADNVSKQAMVQFCIVAIDFFDSNNDETWRKLKEGDVEYRLLFLHALFNYHMYKQLSQVSLKGLTSKAIDLQVTNQSWTKLVNTINSKIIRNINMDSVDSWSPSDYLRRIAKNMTLRLRDNNSNALNTQKAVIDALNNAAVSKHTPDNNGVGFSSILHLRVPMAYFYARHHVSLREQ